MDARIIHSPARWMQSNTPALHLNDRLTEDLSAYESWWFEQGQYFTETVDKHGTPWLQLYDTAGNRIDRICYPHEYWSLLAEGYKRGVIHNTFESKSLLPFFQMMYVGAFFDMGLMCPYTVTMSTAVPIWKYGSEALKNQVLTKLKSKENYWQGATWFTEIKGGSDLARNTETIATKQGDRWVLNGEKYFCSNIGAEAAVVSARIEGAPEGFKGLQLFVVPRFDKEGNLNYYIRRIKDKIGTRSVPTGEVSFCNSEAWLLNENIPGIYLIMEVLNISRISNAIGSVALAQRALSEALKFASQRKAFGKLIIEHPLLKKEFSIRFRVLNYASALAWYAVQQLEKVWLSKPPYDDDYHFFRLIAHLAKYWTADIAVKTARWCMEVHGGIGILQEFNVERLLREAMILPIWEGTPHRQILDGWEVMVKYNLTEALFDLLKDGIEPAEWHILKNKTEALLHKPAEVQEAQIGKLFRKLAYATARTLHRKSNILTNPA